MSHIDAIADADQHLDALHEAQEAQQAAEFALSGDFLLACRKCDANAMATWAPKIRDWANSTLKPLSSTVNAPKRHQTLAEAMEEALDYTNGPSKTELMQLLLNVAYGNDTVNAPAQARALLSRMADTFAANNVKGA